MGVTLMFEWVMGKIGISGFIIIILLGIIGAEAFVIKLNRAKVEGLSIRVSELEGSIKVQNNSIAESGKKAKALQDALDEADKKQKTLQKKNFDLKQELGKTPLPTTCDGAISELKGQTSSLAKRWNSK